MHTKFGELWCTNGEKFDQSFDRSRHRAVLCIVMHSSCQCTLASPVMGHRARSPLDFQLVFVQSTLGARHFCPKIYAWKISKLTEFYMIFARKIFSPIFLRPPSRTPINFVCQHAPTLRSLLSLRLRFVPPRNKSWPRTANIRGI